MEFSKTKFYSYIDSLFFDFNTLFKMTLLKNNINFVHIGKCAGTTVWRTLIDKLPKQAAQMNYFHVSPVPHRPHIKNIITLRNPISRFVSAFYWRYYLVCESNQQTDKYKGELELLKKYETVDNFVSDLGVKGAMLYKSDINSGKYIHQCKQDIYFYLKDIYERNNPNNVEFCITQENLKKDMKTYFGLDKVTLQVHSSKYRVYDKTLSENSISILKNILHMDFKCIDRIHEWGKLSDEQYNLLNQEYRYKKKG